MANSNMRVAALTALLWLAQPGVPPILENIVGTSPAQAPVNKGNKDFLPAYEKIRRLITTTNEKRSNLAQLYDICAALAKKYDRLSFIRRDFENHSKYDFDIGAVGGRIGLAYKYDARDGSHDVRIWITRERALEYDQDQRGNIHPTEYPAIP